MRKIRTISLYVLFALPLFLVLVGAFTQTQMFRDRLRAVALAQLDTLLNAEVHLGALRGNLVTGFSIDSVAVSVKGTPVLRLERLDLAYNLLALPGKTISVRELKLVRPEIMLLRTSSGNWNFGTMIRSNEADTAGKPPFDWILRIARVEIVDGTVTLIDSASLAGTEHEAPDGRSVEYHDFALHRFSFIAGLEIRSDFARAVVESCSFSANNPAFRLQRLSGTFALSPTEASVDSLHIQTANTDLLLSARLREADLVKGIDLAALQHAPVELTLQARPLDCDELKKFLPAVDFLTGRVTAKVRAGGEFGALKVEQLDLRFGTTSLFLQGALANLHNPGSLGLRVKVTESTVVPADIPALMPVFDLPDLSPVGTATLNLEFEGRPADFTTKFLLESAAGSVQSSGLALTVGGPSTLVYDGTLMVRGLDLGRVLDDVRLTSSLNGSLAVRGRGVHISQLESGMTLQIDSSEFRGLPLMSTMIQVDAGRRAIAARGTVALGDMRARLNGNLKSETSGDPTFRLEGEVASLNLEHVLHDSSHTSDITAKLTAEGTGLTWDAVTGTAVLDLSSSRYRDYTIDQGQFHLTIDQRDSLNKTLQFESNIADLNLTGAFSLPYLASLIPFEVRNLRASIGEKIAAIDSSVVRGVDRKALDRASQSLAAHGGRLNARYALQVKDLEPISVAAGNRTFNGSGILTGIISGGYDDLALSADADVDDFFYGTADAGILLEDARVSLELRSLRPHHALNDLTMHLETSAGKLLVNRNTMDSLALTFDYRDEGASFSSAAILNKDTRLRTAANAHVDDNEVTMRIHELEAAYQGFSWRADSGAVLRVNHVSAAVAGLVMRHDSQAVAITASLREGHAIAVSIDGAHLDLDDLKYFLADEELGPQGQAFAGAASFHATASGTAANPIIIAAITGEHISFRTLPFGSLTGVFRYEDRQLISRVDVTATGEQPGAPPVLTIDGTLPLDLRFLGAENRFPEGSMDLHVHSRGVQMSVLDPLLPTFNQLSGVMSCAMTLAGSLKHPTYNGTIEISGCSFLFVPNNIYYTLDGSFQPRGERISIKECVIRNVPEDERSGRLGLIRLGGDFLLRDLKPGDFNITAEGELLVVKESTRKSSLAVYGDLFVEIGPTPLHFTGEVANSLLKGSLLIRNSSLIFPPTQADIAEESARSVPVIFVNDTVRTADRAERRSITRYFAVGHSTPGNAADIELRKSKSFMNGLHYDLDIETGGGNTEIRMIFNPATSEELVATLDGKFTISEDGKRWTGDLTVERAYYNFFKRFDATGTIRYTGDFMNPELNIRATYKGNRTLVDSTSAARQEPVLVTVKITGSRYEPKIEFQMTIDDIDYYSYRGPKSNDVQSDAIQFIVAGSFPLTAAQKNDLATEVRQTAGLSLLTGATSLLTGRLSDFLRTQTGFINSVELSYGGRESTELRLSGTAWSGYWRYGGTILNDPLSNANFSLLYSMGTIFGNPLLRNLMIELERRVEPGTLGQTNDLKRINSARLFYRFSF